MKLNCRIGVEIEADKDFLPQIPESINQLTDNIMLIGDTEYYSEISEWTFNVRSIKYLKEALSYVEDKRAFVYGKTSCGNFVGTHIHIFNKSLYYQLKTLDSRAMAIMDMLIYIYLSKYLNNGQHKSEIHRMVGGYHFLSHIERETRSIWLCRNEERDDDEEQETMYAFPEFALKKERYRIVNISPARRGGKPKSVEIRCLWNSILLRDDIENIIKDLHNILWNNITAVQSPLFQQSIIDKFKCVYRKNLELLQ